SNGGDIPPCVGSDIGSSLTDAGHRQPKRGRDAARRDVFKPDVVCGSCTVTTISSCVGLILRMRYSEADRQWNMRSTQGGANESQLRRLIQERVMERHPQNPQNRGF